MKKTIVVFSVIMIIAITAIGVNFGPTATYTRTFSHGITDF